MVMRKRRRMTTVLSRRVRARRTVARKPRRTSRTSARGIYKGGIVRDKRIVTMRYYFFKVLNSEILMDRHQFRANSIYDPDYTDAGNQCRGFDQYMLLYDNWTVLSSKLSFTVVNHSNYYATVVGVRVNDNATVFDTTASDIMEIKGGNKRLTESKEMKNLKMTYSFNTKKYFGQGGAQLSHSNLVGNAAADCSKQAFYTISTISARGLGNTDLHVIGHIDYKVMLLEPKMFGSS